MSGRQALGDATSRLANAQRVVANMSDEHRAAAENYFKSGDYNAYLKATGGPEPAAGTKRKAQDQVPLLDPEDVNLEGMPMDKSCNQVRGMIRRFLDSGEMKKGEFSTAIGVSATSLNNFLAQNGTMKGAESFTYGNAWEFFKKREMAGIKAPKKAKAATASSSASTSSAAPITDISNISLDGEESSSVQVYDSCDEIRKKINAHLVKPGITQAAFCRDLAAQLHTGTKIQSKQLTDFRSKKGPRMGNTSSVFYAAYIYFEKVRLAENKPKSKHRKEMEEVWAFQGGFDREHGGHLG
jgi:hypothetical protein